MFPYKPTLSLRFQAHINSEIVHCVQAVKYLYKYITKRQERVLLGFGEDSENDTFLQVRLFGASMDLKFMFKPLINNRATENRKNYLRARDPSGCNIFLCLYSDHGVYTSNEVGNVLLSRVIALTL